MSDSHDSRFAPPAAAVQDVLPQGIEAPLASRGRRFVGALIDGLLIFAVVWIVLTMTGFGRGLATSTLGGGLIGLVVFLVLHGWLLVTRGQTIGKALLKMRIVRSDGGRVDPARLLGLRYGVGMVVSMIPLVGGVYGIVDGLLIFRQSHQCLHDTIADTKVIAL